MQQRPVCQPPHIYKLLVAANRRFWCPTFGLISQESHRAARWPTEVRQHQNQTEIPQKGINMQKNIHLYLQRKMHRPGRVFSIVPVNVYWNVTHITTCVCVLQVCNRLGGSVLQRRRRGAAGLWASTLDHRHQRTRIQPRLRCLFACLCVCLLETQTKWMHNESPLLRQVSPSLSRPKQKCPSSSPWSSTAAQLYTPLLTSPRWATCRTRHMTAASILI